MQNVRGLEIEESSREELLPGFSDDFPYIATCAELDRYPEPLVPWHWHKTVELFYMESGCLEYTTPRGKWTFPAGSGGFVNSNVLHTTHWKPSAKSNIQLLHLFEPSLIAGGYGNRMEQKYVLPLCSDPGIELLALYPEDPAQREILRRIREAFDLPESLRGYEFRLREMLSGIWLDLLELAAPMMSTEKPPDRSNEQIKQMMLYVQEHYGEHLSVEDLAEAAYVSKRACFRLFREYLHTTPLDYIRAFRLQKARQLLMKGREPITAVALSCGLGSSSHFGKTFREEFGCTPSEFRRQWQDPDNFGQK